MEKYNQQFKNKADNTISFLEVKLSKLHATGAHPNMLSNIEADYHGEKTPLINMATCRAQDALSMTVIPFEQDKKITKAIVEAISGANIGVTATDEGKQVRVSVPPVTQEKRQEYAKEAKAIAEEAKVAIRNIRHEALNGIKKDDDLSEDLQRDAQDSIQKLVDEYNSKIESHLKNKETELLTV